MIAAPTSPPSGWRGGEKAPQAPQAYTSILWSAWGCPPVTGLRKPSMDAWKPGSVP
jgi:hypothetical protein